MLATAKLCNPADATLTKFVHTAINKIRYPVNVCCWTPDGRRYELMKWREKRFVILTGMSPISCLHVQSSDWRDLW